MSPKLRSEVRELQATLPLSFEANQGQTDPRARFVARALGYRLFLTAGGAILSPEHGSAPLSITLVGASKTPDVSGLGELPGKNNYFIGGDPRKWRTGVPLFRQVRFAAVYPGIDLVYYGKQRELEYDFHVAAGSDPRRIRLRFGGAERPGIDRNGELVLRTAKGEVRQRKPVLYQDIDGVRRSVSGRYTMRSPTDVGFDVGTYDTSKPLVIDPVLLYSSYLGGAGDDVATDVAVDAAGMIYVTGWTNSVNFPTRNTIMPPPLPDVFHPQFGRRGEDVFVTKIDPTESGEASVVYSTYLGGSASDQARAIAVDAGGNAYIAGWTISMEHPGFPDTSAFPVTAGAFQSTLKRPLFGIPSDGFIAKLNPSGSALLYSTYFGGASIDTIDDLAVDSGGRVFVTGQTESLKADASSGQSPLPTSPGAYQTEESPLIANGAAAFVASFDPAAVGAASLLYSTYLGGTGAEGGRGIAVNASGEALIAGWTSSFDLPTASGFQLGNRGGISGFVSRFSADGTSLLYSTYVGGATPCPFSGCNTGDLTDIALDGAGKAYVTGRATPGLPAAPDAYHSTPVGGGFAPFVMKLDTEAAGAASVGYVTYVNAGGFFDGAEAIAVDVDRNVYIAGTTSGPFPTTPDAVSLTHRGAGDGFVAKLNPSGTTLLYSTYLGGVDNDVARGIAVDGNGNMFVVGETRSTDFAVVNPAQPAFGGWTRDAFVSLIWRPTFTISGQVLDGTSQPVAGVTLALEGSRITTTTSGANGVYSFALPSEESYTVTPSRAGYTFVPASRVYSPLFGNEVGDFTAISDIPPDTAAPVITCASADGLWHGVNITIACSAADAGSGLATAADASFTLVTSVAPGVETASADTDARVVCDLAGNCASAGPVIGNKIDRKGPSMAIASPVANARYAINERVTAAYGCVDAGSGISTCAGPVPAAALVDTSTPGPRQFMVNGVDVMGNGATITVAYSVGFGVRTFYETNKAHKSGSTIPIRIQLIDGGGNNLSSPALVVSAVGIVRVSDEVSDALADPSEAAAGTDFKYDPSLPGYHYNFKTIGLASGRYVLLFRVSGDTATYSVPFQVR